MENNGAERGIYQRNDEYTGRMPSPPRISIPHPQPFGNRAHQLLDNAISSRPELEFLRRYDWNDLLNCQGFFIDWKYEYRRQAQKIIPFVYLGPLSVCRDKEFLVKEQITMIVAIRHPPWLVPGEPQPRHGALKVAADLGIETHTISVCDNQELIGWFSRVTKLMNDHLYRLQTHEANTISPTVLGKVLVVCESGNERSTAAVAAYTMQVFEISMKDALQLIHERRFCVNVDDEMKHVLFAYEDILQAKRDVARDTNIRSLGSGLGLVDPQANLNSKTAAPKRTLDDEDEDMEDDDMLRFGNRGFRPFTDFAS